MCQAVMHKAEKVYPLAAKQESGSLDYKSLRHIPVTNLPRKSGADAIAVKTPSRPSGATDML